MDDSEPQSGGVFADIFPAEWAADGEFCEYLGLGWTFFVITLKLARISTQHIPQKDSLGSKLFIVSIFFITIFVISVVIPKIAQPCTKPSCLPTRSNHSKKSQHVWPTSASPISPRHKISPSKTTRHLFKPPIVHEMSSPNLAKLSLNSIHCSTLYQVCTRL